MPYPIDKKLVVGVSTSALFNLEVEHQVYEREGVAAYCRYQESYKDVALEKGPAFPFIRRFLNVNKVYDEQMPVEVVILSRNSADTGIRAFNSIEHYELDITRAAFTSGNPPLSIYPVI